MSSNSLRFSRLARASACAIALAAGALGLTGCGPDFDRITIDGVVALPGAGQTRIDVARIVVPEGMALKARIAAYNSDGELMVTRIVPKNPAVMSYSRVITDNDYAFYGIAAGETKIDVFADDELVLVINANVVPQSAAP